MSKIKYIEQMEHSECALACIAMICNYYNYKINLSTLRDEYGVPVGGYNILQISQILNSYNIDSKGIKINDITSINKNMFPLIGYWNDNHYVIIEKIKKDKVLVTNPSFGKLWITLEEFKKSFSNKAITCSPNKDFQNYKDKNRTTFFLSLILEKKGNIFGLIICSLLIQLFAIIIPIINQKVIDSLNTSINTTFLNKIGIDVLVFTISYYILSTVRSYVIVKIQVYFDKQLMSKLLRHLLNLPYSFFTNRSTGELIFRANSNSYISQILTEKLVSIFIDSLLVFIYLFIMFKYSIPLSLFTIGIAIILIILSIINSKKFNSLTNDEMVEQVKVQKILTEMIDGIMTIKSMGGENIFFKKWNKLFDKQLQFTYKKGVLNSFLSNISNSLLFILPMIIIWYGSYSVISGDLTVGMIVAFNTIAISFLQPIISLTGSYSNILILKTILGKLYDIINSKTEKILTDNILNINAGKIEFKNVYFKYNRFDPHILKNISFSINPGEKVAIVGKSGSGKSTLLKLILGLYNSQSGNIYIDDTNIKDINLKNLRSQFGVILQEPLLFNDSIKENIIIGKENISNTQINEAVIKSGINNFLVNVPLGIDTIISEKGTNFSGGQRQRISLARALINNPKIILMDEPTSSLDNEAEASLINEVLKLDSTCIVISHRLNTIENFDKIIVIDDGKIVECGSHNELIINKGCYYNIYNSKVAV